MIEKLNAHYSFTNPATIHDEEALTALELAGRTGAKVNELITAYNELEADTNEHLDAQDTEISTRLEAQDNAIPVKVKSEFQKNVDNGTFNNMIDEHAGELTKRLDNLLGTVVSGSTTMDAEIIDARLDALGNTNTNIGNAIRIIDNYLYNQLKGNSKIDFEILEITLVDTGFVDNTGTWQPNTTTGGSHACTTIEGVKSGEVYFIRTRYGFGMPDAVCQDNDNNLVKYFHMNSSATIYNDFELPIVIPEGATKLVVNSMNNLVPIIVKKVVGNRTNLDMLSSYLNNLLDTLPLTNKYSDALSPEAEYTDCTIDYGYTNPGGAGSDPWVVRKYSIVEGKRYKRVCGAGWGHMTYTILDKNGNAIEFSESMLNYTEEETEFIAPPYATTILLAGNSSSGTYCRANLYEVNSSEGGKWSHLKWVCMGDSITEANARTTKNYHDYVHEATDINVVNMGVSGTGYAKHQDTGNAFYQRILNVPTDADVVTIFGSGNDLSSGLPIGEITDTGTSTLCGCINKTIDNLYSVLPTVQLGIVSPSPWVGKTPSDNSTMTEYADKMKQIAERRGIPFLDLFRCSGLRPNEESFRNLAYSKDEGNGVHPDETGHKMIASQFYRFLDSLIGIY